MGEIRTLAKHILSILLPVNTSGGPTPLHHGTNIRKFTRIGKTSKITLGYGDSLGFDDKYVAIFNFYINPT
jgi:hypothetical protein